MSKLRTKPILGPAVVGVVLAGAALASPATASGATMSLQPVERRGPPDPVYDEAQVALLKALTRHAGAPVLAARSRKAPCPVDDDRCLAEAARLARVDALVAGTFERFPEGYSVHLRRVDAQGTGRVQVRRLVQGGAPDLVATMELAACELATQPDCTTPLRVDGPPDARLSLDGADAGPLPIDRRVPLGRHRLRLQHGARASADLHAVFVFGEARRFTTDVSREPLVLTEAPSASDDLLPPPPPMDFELPPLPPVEEEPPAPAAPPPAVEQPLVPATPPVVVEQPRAPEPQAVVVEQPRAPEPPPLVVQPPPASTPIAAGDPVRGTTRVPVAPPPPPDRPRSAAWIPPATVGTAIAGGTLTLVGLVFGGVAGLQAADVNGKFESRTLRPSDAPTYASARANAVTANVLFGLAGLSLVTSGVLFALDPDATLRFAGVSAGAGGFHVSGTFE